LPAVLYGCENWSLTLRKERKLRVFENRVLRGIFGPKRDEVTGEWRQLHIAELNYLYSSSNIIRVIKWRRWVGHIACVGGGQVYKNFLWGNLRERDHLENSSVDGRIILRWIFSKWDVRAWAGLIWLRIGTGRSIEHSGSIKCGEFLDYLSRGLLLKTDSAPWNDQGSKCKCIHTCNGKQ